MLDFWRRRKKQKEWENESFNARLIMEKNAQREMMARLRVVEMQFKNQTRMH